MIQCSKIFSFTSLKCLLQTKSTHAHNFSWKNVALILWEWNWKCREAKNDKTIILIASTKIIIRIEQQDSRRQKNRTKFVLNDNFVTECERWSKDQLSRFETNIETKQSWYIAPRSRLDDVTSCDNFFIQYRFFSVRYFIIAVQYCSFIFTSTVMECAAFQKARDMYDSSNSGIFPSRKKKWNFTNGNSMPLRIFITLHLFYGPVRPIILPFEHRTSEMIHANRTWLEN